MSFISGLPGYRSEWQRAEPERLYATLEDFRRAPPGLRRLVVVGSSGSGKSTLLNIMGGWKLVQRPPDYDYAWEPKDGKVPLFKAEVSAQGVTRRTEFANVFWFGSPSQPFTAIDTQGLDDPDFTEIQEDEVRDRIHEMAADLHDKLQAIGHVHVILVLHNDVFSNRLNPALYEVLKMVDQKFSRTGQSVWGNVAVAYTKCNDHDTSWRNRLALKKQQQQQAIRRQIASCGVDVPIFALGGAKLGPSAEQGSEAERSRSRSPRRAPGVIAASLRGSGSTPSHIAGSGHSSSRPTIGRASDFDGLWEFINNASALDTSKLLPFDGPDVKWQKIIDAKNVAEARAKAAAIYTSVVPRLLLLLAFLFWRAFMVPTAVGRFLLLNFPGVFDEVLYLILFVCWVGPEDVWYSLRHFYEVWIQPQLQPYLDHFVSSKQD